MRTIITISLILFSLLCKAQFNADSYQSLVVLSCTDEDNDEVYFTIISGNKGGYFQILPCNGLLQVDTNAYSLFTKSKTWYLTIGCTDPKGNTGRQTLTVQLRKINNDWLPPVLKWIE